MVSYAHVQSVRQLHMQAGAILPEMQDADIGFSAVLPVRR